MDERVTMARSRVPNYSPELFVNREEAINVVLNKVRSVLAGHLERKRVIVFWGYRGAGKTWLLRHLAETELPKIPGVYSVYINLEAFGDKPVNGAMREMIVGVMEAVHRDRKQAEPGDVVSQPPTLVPLDRLSEHLLVRIQEISSAGTVLVLLLDFVYGAAPELLETLETHVLGPLLFRFSHVVIVMAGRGQWYPWKNTMLRLQVEDCELKPFEDAAYTRQQLRKQRPDAAPHANGIHQSTLGYPLANVVIPYPLDKATRDQMREMMDVLLEPIRNSDGSWPIERTYLEALCVLRTFDEERIPVLLDAYDPTLAPKGDWTLAKASEVVRSLIRTNLVRWNSEESGWWIVDQAIRHLLEEYLRVVDEARWRRCHEAAIQVSGFCEALS